MTAKVTLMQNKNEVVCYCPLEGVIDVISKKWALLVINAIGNYGSLRFNRLIDELHGISPKTLADTLKRLQNEQLLKRESFAEIPPRVEYSLTEDGQGLREAVVPILKWAATRQGSKRKKCSLAYRKISAHRIGKEPFKKGNLKRVLRATSNPLATPQYFWLPEILGL